ncbi:TPA: hypothetical protein J1731_000044 [Escherichia coli]|uniref:hypothetical protein n=1 Tax=Escherichia coli TaxID=562 RepID=UPI0017CF63C5|nr:hypothetical protein [Escherichia coli]EFA4158460.1 hypothetical protein [Escherichia coli O174:H7]EFM6563258.1 hypothetical protein [Escherichia coli]EFM6582901.1 hypothetical protein [Escherichia coli]EIL3299027.1 hypothetical protein [Escherichia coli]EIN5414568.1 hypothetical protein [Escherichia coli]
MIQQSKYVASQAWCTPVANYLLVKASAYVGLPTDFNAFLPGLAVVIAHFFLLLLTFVNVPSIEDVRFKVDVARARKSLIKMRGNASDAEKESIDNALAVLRSKQIEKTLRDVDHSMELHKHSLQNDMESM